MEGTEETFTQNPEIEIVEESWTYSSEYITVLPHSLQTFIALDMAFVFEYEPDKYTKAHFVLDVVITGLLCLVGFVGNVLAVVVLRKEPRKGATVWLLIALAVADWFILLHVFQEKVITNFCRYMQYDKCYWALKDAWPYTWPLGCMAQTSMVWLVVVVTVDRYVAICHPFRAVSWSTVGRAKRAILAIVVCSVIFNIPRFFHTMGADSEKELEASEQDWQDTWEPYTGAITGKPAIDIVNSTEQPSWYDSGTDYENWDPYSGVITGKPAIDIVNSTEQPSWYDSGTDYENYVHEEEYPSYYGDGDYYPDKSQIDILESASADHGYVGTNLWYRFVYFVTLTWFCVYLIPLVLLCGLNTRLMIAIRKARKLHAALTANQKQSEKDNLAVTLNIVAVVTVFLVCQTPDFVLVVITYPAFEVDNVRLSYYGSVCTVLLALNSSVNFAIYCLFYPKFRRIMIHTLCPVVLGDPKMGKLRKSFTKSVNVTEV